MVVSDQLEFIRNKNLGYNKENLLIIERTNILQEKQASFLEELRTISSVKSVASSGTLPINQYFGIQFQIPGRRYPDVFPWSSGSISQEEQTEKVYFVVLPTAERQSWTHFSGPV